MNSLMNLTQLGSARNMALLPSSESSLEDNQNRDHDIYLTSYDIFYLKQIKNIRMSLPWVIVAFGLIGNLFILMIFLKRSKRFTSNGLCFTALAISDSFALLFMLMRSMLKLQIVSNVSATCKIIKYVYHVSLQISSWCLVLLTIDRLIAVVFIFKYTTWCKKWHSIKVLIAIIISIIVINLHLLIFVSSDIYVDKNPIRTTSTTSTKKVYHHGFKPKEIIKVEGPIYICSVDSVQHPIYYKYFYSQWDIFHALIYGIIPFVIILISNILIILKLTVLKKKKFFKSNLSGSSKSLEKLDTSFKSFQITLMLISIAFVFLIFTSPISLYMTIFDNNLKSVRESKREFIKVILRYIGYCNNAVNFYVYVSFSNEFRKEFIKTIKSCCSFKPITSTVSLCTRSTTLGSTNILPQQDTYPEINNDKPIKRSKLRFKQKSDETDTTANDPFISSSNPFNTNDYVDAVELFKKNTRTAKLNHYKRSGSSSSLTSINKQNKPFISNEGTMV